MSKRYDTDDRTETEPSARAEPGPADGVVAVSTEDGVVIYDRDRMNAWVSSSMAFPVEDMR